MNKILISSILILASSSVFSEASIDSENNKKTYLLTAPGTITGNRGGVQGDSTSAVPTIPVNSREQRQGRMRYNYVGERKKFRQFGQKRGNNNPWFDEYRANYPRNMAPSNMPPITNPWQLGGMPSFKGIEGARPGAYSNQPSSRYGSDNYFGSNNLSPDFPVGIYRDTNPAAFPMPGNMNKMLPGIGGDNFDFPFSPFGMF